MSINLNMRLSTNFTLNELIQSESALRHGIDNTPSEAAVQNLRTLCTTILQPVRNYYNLPLKVTSGYRSPTVNSIIGGSKTSDHCYGFAADIEVPSISNYALALYIQRNFKFTQLILEFYTPGIPDSGWVHISHDPARLKCESLTATRRGNLVVYTSGLVA